MSQPEFISPDEQYTYACIVTNGFTDREIECLEDLAEDAFEMQEEQGPMAMRGPFITDGYEYEGGSLHTKDGDD